MFPMVDGLADPPPASHRRILNLVIAAALAYHILVPLRFYWAGSGLDERFSWRFFSSTSLMKHDFRVEEILAPSIPDRHPRLPIQRLLQVAVVKKLLSTHHEDCVKAFLRWRAAQPGVREVHYYRTTTTTDGRVLPAVHCMARHE